MLGKVLSLKKSRAGGRVIYCFHVLGVYIFLHKNVFYI